MIRYIQWDDVINRYPALETLQGADEMSSAYIVYAEAFTDGMLAGHYTVPFSDNNVIVRDLAIDMTYWRATRFKLDDAADVASAYFETVSKLVDGTLTMVDDTGTIIPALKKPIGLFSTTQSYHPAFGMSPTIEQHIDQDLIEDERDRRNG